MKALNDKLLADLK